MCPLLRRDSSLARACLHHEIARGEANGPTSLEANRRAVCGGTSAKRKKQDRIPERELRPGSEPFRTGRMLARYRRQARLTRVHTYDFHATRPPRHSRDAAQTVSGEDRKARVFALPEAGSETYWADMQVVRCWRVRLASRKPTPHCVFYVGLKPSAAMILQK